MAIPGRLFPSHPFIPVFCGFPVHFILSAAEPISRILHRFCLAKLQKETGSLRRGDGSFVLFFLSETGGRFFRLALSPRRKTGDVSSVLPSPPRNSEAEQPPLSRSAAKQYNQSYRSSKTRLLFFSLRGSRPFSTTLTSGVKPMTLFTFAAIRSARSRKSTEPLVST